MFPDKVERLIVDGIVDPTDYYTTKWMTGLKDTTKTLHWFFNSCKEAGPESCAFYEDSVEAMEAKLNDLYAAVIEAPVPFRTDKNYGVVDYSFLHQSVLSVLYAPSNYPRLAEGLQGLVERNGTALVTLVADVFPFECDCEGNKYEFAPNGESLTTYICNDGEAVPPGLEEAKAHYQESVDFSPFGSIFASFRISCSGWSPDIPKPQFRGPIAGNTSFPLLFIGNTADPVTPLEAAYNASRGFPGSVVLTQDSPGHASINAPSVCTSQAVREYFVDGTLPKEGTVCPMDGSLFNDSTAGGSGSTATKRDGVDENGAIVDVLWDFATSRAVTRRGRIMSPLNV
ncbi:hypothetical protein V5O48_009661 [Marasmius crinis-equi]|uniref:Peptidase S33 tripeptidyl aminopeptidase-like C-terminal domain-containing protein n=1 Tax=Marasmius crinis-equi TaxID=585013 RepID=A0ABR3FAJ9_9AGAR